MSWIEVRLTAEEAGRTRLEIEHIAAAGDRKWAEFGPGAVGIGWDMTIMGLSLHLAGQSVPGPRSFAAWAASGEGKRFMELSGNGWCEAHIGSGEDEAGARAMAGRTIAFYTGSPGEPSG